MRYESVRKHYKRTKTPAKLTSLVSYGFASAIASVDVYDDDVTRASIKELGQDPDQDLSCVYCGEGATGWDHLHALVKDGEYTGRGHVLANLVPSCARCNASKGNSNWRDWMRKEGFDSRMDPIAEHQAECVRDRLEGTEVAQLLAQYRLLRQGIIERMHEAEELSGKIRAASERMVRQSQDSAA